jgi:hypothetical protein
VSLLVPLYTFRRSGTSLSTNKADLGVGFPSPQLRLQQEQVPFQVPLGMEVLRQGLWLGAPSRLDSAFQRTLDHVSSRRRASEADPLLQSWSAPSEFLSSCSKFTWWAPTKNWVYPTSVSLPFDLWLGLGWSSYKGPSSSWSCSKSGDDGFE